jgi:hypothetical protein
MVDRLKESSIVSRSYILASRADVLRYVRSQVGQPREDISRRYYSSIATESVVKSAGSAAADPVSVTLSNTDPDRPVCNDEVLYFRFSPTLVTLFKSLERISATMYLHPGMKGFKIYHTINAPKAFVVVNIDAADLNGDYRRREGSQMLWNIPIKTISGTLKNVPKGGPQPKLEIDEAGKTFVIYLTDGPNRTEIKLPGKPVAELEAGKDSSGPDIASIPPCDIVPVILKVDAATIKRIIPKTHIELPLYFILDSERWSFMISAKDSAINNTFEKSKHREDISPSVFFRKFDVKTPISGYVKFSGLKGLLYQITNAKMTVDISIVENSFLLFNITHSKGGSTYEKVYIKYNNCSPSEAVSGLKVKAAPAETIESDDDTRCTEERELSVLNSTKEPEDDGEGSAGDDSTIHSSQLPKDDASDVERAEVISDASDELPY